MSLFRRSRPPTPTPQVVQRASADDRLDAAIAELEEVVAKVKAENEARNGGRS